MSIDSNLSMDEEGHVVDDVALLVLRGMSKRYGKTAALQEVDLALYPGEIHAVMGENGAGKSTLNKIITGAITADTGTIFLDGKEQHISDPANARELGIGAVYQEFTLLPNLTIAENLFLGNDISRYGILDRDEMRKRSLEVLRRLDIELDPDEKVSRLVVAERQAVEICKALTFQARVLILDEPTAALSEHERRELFKVIKSLAGTGVAILYVSHHLGEIMHLADRVTVLRNGQRVFTRPIGSLTERQIVEAMVGREVGDIFPERVETAPMSEAPRVVASGLEFGSRLCGVDMEVYSGEIVGLTGLVGSGHQELGRILAGVLSPTRGVVDRRDQSISFTPGNRKTEGLALERPVRENLTISMLERVSGWFGLSRFARPAEDRKQAMHLARAMSLVGDVEGETQFLSGGNQQKALIGRAVGTNPTVVILEEPSRGVDVGAKADLYRVLRDLADGGTAVVVVSTDLRELAGLCDRVVVLERGRLAAHLNYEEADEGTIFRRAHGIVDLEAEESSDDLGAGRKRRGGLLSHDALIPVAAFLLLFVVTAIGSDVFLSAENMQNLARQGIVIALIGIGQLVVVLAAGIDLSIGATVGLANLLATSLLLSFPDAFPLIAIVVLAMGAFIGLINGGVTRIGVTPLLVTFAMASIIRGLVVWRYPRSIGPVPESVWVIDRHSTFGIPTGFIVVILLVLAVGSMLRSTAPGLRLYAMGSDERSAMLSGVRTGRYVVGVYVVSGVLAALAGIYLTARVGAGLPNSGSGLELDSIAVVMIGGASLAGGRGTVVGTVAGVGIVVVLANLMNLWNLDAFYQDLIKGAIIVSVAIAWAMVERRRRTRDRLRV